MTFCTKSAKGNGKPLPKWIISLSEGWEGGDDDYITSTDAAKFAGITTQAVNHIFRRVFEVEHLKLPGERIAKPCVMLGDIKKIAKLMKQGPVWLLKN